MLNAVEDKVGCIINQHVDCFAPFGNRGCNHLVARHFIGDVTLGRDGIVRHVANKALDFANFLWRGEGWRERERWRWRGARPVYQDENGKRLTDFIPR